MAYNIHRSTWLKRFVRQIRFHFNDKRAVHKGRFYHHHTGDIVVSRHELEYQLMLNCADCWVSLLRLLTYGRACPDYETAILLVSLKFCHFGRFVYSENKANAEKLTHQEYAHYLFEGFYETLDEVRKHISHFHKGQVPDELAKQVFKKLLFIINACCPLMADCTERWYYHTYYSFVEYAIEHDDLGIPECDNMWDVYPKGDVPCGSVRSYVLKDMPEAFVKKVCYTNYDSFRFDEIVEGL